MWTYGYTEWDLTDKMDTSADPCMSPIEVILGEERTFAQAITNLLKWVQNEMNEAEEYEMDNWSALEADIRDIHDDPGIMNDPDQWEDTTFNDSYDTEFFIQEV